MTCTYPKCNKKRLKYKLYCKEHKKLTDNDYEEE